MRVSLSRERLYKFLFIVAFCHNTIFEYVRIVISKMPIVAPLSYIFFPAIYIFLIYGGVTKEKINLVRWSDFVFIIGLIIAFLLTFVMYPRNEKYILNALTEDILPCFPFFFLGLVYKANEDTNNALGLWSCFAIIINVLYVIYYMQSGRTMNTDSMYRSYLLLPNTMMAINFAFRKRKLFAFAVSFIGIVYAFSMGTRGPVVILAVFIAISIWRNINARTYLKASISAILVAATYLFYNSTSYAAMLTGIQTLLKSEGLSTRIVDYLISEQMISYASGRDVIYNTLISKLSERPLLGYGIYGEWQFGVAGAHNMYLEILFHFGIILGSVLLLIGVVIYISALKKAKDNFIMDWLALFGCYVFIQGIFGGSYLRYGVFFLLGLSLQTIRESTLKPRRTVQPRRDELAK